MATPIPTPDVVLRLCGDAGPAPWFPSQYASEMGVDRDSLDVPLNELRLAGLVRIGGWESGKGQCYVLTDFGRSTLADPRAMAQLRSGKTLNPVTEPNTPARTTRATTWDRGEAVRGAFMAQGAAPAVYGLIASQILVFMAGMFIVMRHDAPLNQYLSSGLTGQPAQPPLPSWFLIERRVELGEWWRLISYAFVHYGALHLLMNAYGLVTLGPIVERMFGSVRFFLLYMLSALGGAIAVLLLAPELSATGGSSGAVCGLIGGFAAFVLLNRSLLGRGLYDHSRRWLGNTIVLLVMFSLLPRVSWQAHLGGFIGGFASGVLLNYQRFGTTEQRWAALLGLIILPVAGLVPLFERGIMHWPRPERGVATASQQHSRPIRKIQPEAAAFPQAPQPASSLDFTEGKAYK